MVGFTQCQADRLFPCQLSPLLIGSGEGVAFQNRTCFFPVRVLFFLFHRWQRRTDGFPQGIGGTSQNYRVPCFGMVQMYFGQARKRIRDAPLISQRPADAEGFFKK